MKISNLKLSISWEIAHAMKLKGLFIQYTFGGGYEQFQGFFQAYPQKRKNWLPLGIGADFVYKFNSSRT